MNLLFHDNKLHLALAPLTLTRPVSEIRFGILTIGETWSKLLKPAQTGFITEKYLSVKFKSLPGKNALTVAGNIKPDKELAKWVLALKPGEKLEVNNRWIASNGAAKKTIQKTKSDLLFIEHSWDIFQKNAAAIALDFGLLTEKRKSQSAGKTNQTVKSSRIFIEKGARVNFCILNASEGPIYIGKDAEIMEGSVIRGPFALCEHSTVKMAAKIYGPTTVGPYCKVGGEISNSVFQAYSNKGHDGFLGNSVVGEWCNFGADTNSSNLMNTYGKLKIYSYQTGKQEQTSITFCGVIMGDHSKTGINTMLNTATVVGVSANIFGAGFPAKHVPSFTWGGAESSTRFKLDKAFEVATNMMQRRNLALTAADKKILSHLHGLAQ
ncbi:MAG: GlmU family protein [Bacteroidetes bacterium]|nr:GlmU family protein [Bacteroidota bacterium]